MQVELPGVPGETNAPKTATIYVSATTASATATAAAIAPPRTNIFTLDFRREFLPKGMNPSNYVAWLQYRQQWFGTNLGPWRNVYWLPFDGALPFTGDYAALRTKDYGAQCNFRVMWQPK
jgi:hypothetical protein